MSEFRIGGLLFTSKFDSGNLAHVEKVQQSSINTLSGGDHEYVSSNPTSSNNTNNPGSNPTGTAGDQTSPLRNAPQQHPSGGAFSSTVPDLEVNCWTRRDAAGTEFENGNRTWFYFAVKGAPSGKYVKMNMMNLNRQFRLFQQGMCPVYRVLPQKPNWDRIREKPTYMNVDEYDFMISFCHRFEHKNSTVEFAFCFPFSYSEYQKWMTQLDTQFAPCHDNPPITTRESTPDAIYYHRELAIKSLDGNRVDLITISSYDGICEEREHDVPCLFPDTSMNSPRPYRFRHKKVFFLSSRVHPGETPASFVFNGFLKFILRPDDPRAIALRRLFVFKLMPMLNPDGVMNGHYRTDSRGVNLNRVYLNPDLTYHSPIYAARQILFYHHVFNAVANPTDSRGRHTSGSDKENGTGMIPTSAGSGGSSGSGDGRKCPCIVGKGKSALCCRSDPPISKMDDLEFLSSIGNKSSGIAYYVDLHGHASKRGCFMYGNHMENMADHVENLLYPKLISLNSAHFDFGACNFTEKNMYMKDKRDGASKEGAGRVAMFKILGLTHSYTLECNYNTGRQTNCIASAANDDGRATPPPPVAFPPRYGICHYEDVGKAVAIAALDMMGMNPWSRIAMSEFMNVHACRLWVHRFVQGLYNGPGVPRKTNIKNSGPKPMAHNYLSHLDKEDVQSGVSSILSRNRFPLRNNRQMQREAQLQNQTTASSVSVADPGVGGGSNYVSSSNVNSGNSYATRGASAAGGNTSGTTGPQVSKNLGPIRENKAFQMRRQRLLQITRTNPQGANANNTSNSAGNAGGSSSSSSNNHSNTANNRRGSQDANNNAASMSSTPNHFIYQDGSNSRTTPILTQPTALKQLLNHQHSTSKQQQQSNEQRNSVNPNTSRAVYNLPVTNNNYAQSLLGPQFEAGSAMNYLNKNLPIHVNNQPGGSSTIAGLAIISPRKAHAYIQKGNPPPGSNQQQTLAPFSRSKLGINRSLSVLQPNPNHHASNLMYSSAGSSSNVNAQHRSNGTPVNNTHSNVLKKTSYSQNDLTNVGKGQQQQPSRQIRADNSNDAFATQCRLKQYRRPISASSFENDEDYSDTRLLEGFSSHNQSALLMATMTGDKSEQVVATPSVPPRGATGAESNGNVTMFERVPSAARKSEPESLSYSSKSKGGKTTKRKVKKKKSTGSIGGQNSKNTPNTSLYATGKSSGDHRTKLKESHDTTAAIQLLSRENGGGGGGGGGQNYKKSSIKSASSSTNNTPTVKRRKSSKRSANSGSTVSA
ncbi:cytosolic carboxypeptidase-like protein 5 isoform X2 [Symsagittifera roscoffensis]|uniref:cytosolic carboxypeptidase-like protein 5 isoform X2 n=1 Tax=Symsagittifera roscoffensis TaxID=84072 RepID=UPI00307BC1C1